MKVGYQILVLVLITESCDFLFYNSSKLLIANVFDPIIFDFWILDKKVKDIG